VKKSDVLKIVVPGCLLGQARNRGKRRSSDIFNSGVLWFRARGLCPRPGMTILNFFTCSKVPSVGCANDAAVRRAPRQISSEAVRKIHTAPGGECRFHSVNLILPAPLTSVLRSFGLP
jgi:hypothetical protein